MGSNRRGKDETVWFHAVLSRPGLGGHCIPINPFYLTWKAREYGQYTHFIELAGEINTRMPKHVVHTVADALNTHCKPIKRSNILILGLVYEPNVDDERESPNYVLMKLLAERGAEITYYDPYAGRSSSQPVITRNLPEGDPSRGTGQRLRILISFSWRRTIRQRTTTNLASGRGAIEDTSERDGGHARIARKSLEG